MNHSPDNHTVPKLDGISDQQKRTICEEYERLLMKPEARMPISLDPEFKKKFPAKAGVYAIFENGELVYVGEGASLSERLSKLKSTRTHTLRRKIGRRVLEI